MRQILLAAIVLGAILASAVPAGASCFGRCGGAWLGPPVVAYYPPPYYYAPPVYSPYAYPYPYASSYFRPDVPYGWNAARNWRDTWQDDGVKIHSYTLR